MTLSLLAAASIANVNLVNMLDGLGAEDEYEDDDGAGVPDLNPMPWDSPTDGQRSKAVD